MSLTAVTTLLEKYGVDPKQIGRLDIGTETILDKSKSIKMFLMPIFEASGNTDVEGVDSTNPCYEGTAALFNCVNWVESSSWDGRYGLVVCTDNFLCRVYPERLVRLPGGAAAIAMLIGPDALVVFESKLRGSRMSLVYDFYKPNLTSEYVVLYGKLSETSYSMALDSCYKHFCHKFEKLEGKQFSISDAAYFVFHSPYCKFVQKSFARLVFNDHLRNANELSKEKLAPFSSLSGDESYSSHDLQKVSVQVTKPLYDEKVQRSTLIPKQIGNTYTASLYAASASLIDNKHSTLGGKRIILFSYGRGLASTMFSLQLRDGPYPFSLSNTAAVMDVEKKLKSTHEFPPEKYVEIRKLMEHMYGAKEFATTKDCSLLSPGSYYLTEVDSMPRRFYARKTKDGN
ncbi:hypothetical protein BT93_E0353 [Corymbia citriodora subsp. variegata]|nr:hypothetical protein BT93_E0353 [Corymbia citriodora subsp. variegata]